MDGNGIGGWGMPNLGGSSSQGSGNSMASFMQMAQHMMQYNALEAQREAQREETERHNRQAELASRERIETTRDNNRRADFEKRMTRAAAMANSYLTQYSNAAQRVLQNDNRELRSQLNELHIAINATKSGGFNQTRAVQEIDAISAARAVALEIKANRPGLPWSQVSMLPDIVNYSARSNVAKEYFARVFAGNNGAGENPDEVAKQLIAERQPNLARENPYLGRLTQVITARTPQEHQFAKAALQDQLGKMAQGGDEYNKLVKHNLDLITSWEGDIGAGSAQEADPSQALLIQHQGSKSPGTPSFSGTITGADGKVYAVPVYGAKDTSTYDTYNASHRGTNQDKDSVLRGLQQLQRELGIVKEPKKTQGGPAPPINTEPVVAPSQNIQTQAQPPAAAPNRLSVPVPGKSGERETGVDIGDITQSELERAAKVATLGGDVQLAALKSSVNQMIKHPDWEKVMKVSQTHPEHFWAAQGHLANMYPNFTAETIDELAKAWSGSGGKLPPGVGSGIGSIPSPSNTNSPSYGIPRDSMFGPPIK